LKDIKVHITFFILGVFIFPFIFQSIHIIRHHYQDDSENIYFLKVKSNNHNFQKNISINLLSRDNHCLICEYQFAINSLPEIQYFVINISISNSNFKEETIAEPHKQIINTKSSRAPPLLNS